MRLLGCVIVLLGLMSGTSYTQTYEGSELVSATVLCGSSNFSRPFTIGIKLKLEPGWHTYWKNPGDSGIPLEVEAVGAEPYRLGPLQFPTPHRFTTESGVSYGYDDSVIVLAQVFPPKNASNLPPPAFDIKLKWLVCKHICLPGSTTLRFEPGLLNPQGLGFDRAQIDRWTARLPQPGIGYNFEDGNVNVTTKGDELLVKTTFLGASPNTITDFYPEEIPGFVLDHAKVKITDAGFEFPLVRSEPSSRLTVLKGIVIVDGQGYDVTIPVREQ
jgi:DsbC/DsbD-like thiol-disulfide interchange protein